jgi:acetyltransferase-like isoleucine patch superfamily enzyme
VPSLQDRLRQLTGDALLAGWEQVGRLATIRAGTARARRFRRFGDGSSICFPVAALFGEEHIEIGRGTIVGPYVTMSTGIMPGATGGRPVRLTLGDGCLIGRGSGIVTHESIEIGDNVFAGHHVYITDSSHGYEDMNTPIGRQFGDVHPVRIGEGTWLGHGSLVLPGADIGRHAVIGAQSVVTGSVPDFSVAVGIPARVIRRYVTGEGWVRVDEHVEHADHHALAAPPTRESAQAGEG